MVEKLEGNPEAAATTSQGGLNAADYLPAPLSVDSGSGAGKPEPNELVFDNPFGKKEGSGGHEGRSKNEESCPAQSKEGAAEQNKKAMPPEGSQGDGRQMLLQTIREFLNSEREHLRISRQAK